MIGEVSWEPKRRWAGGASQYLRNPRWVVLSETFTVQCEAELSEGLLRQGCGAKHPSPPPPFINKGELTRICAKTSGSLSSRPCLLTTSAFDQMYSTYRWIVLWIDGRGLDVRLFGWLRRSVGWAERWLVGRSLDGWMVSELHLWRIMNWSIVWYLAVKLSDGLLC